MSFRHLLRITSLVMLGLGTLVTTAAVLPADYSRIWPITDKLTHLHQRTEPYDLLFIGSSRVFRGISPMIFDYHLDLAGHSMESFNFGILGMRVVEAWRLLETIAANPATRPRWIIFEADSLSEIIERANLSQARTLYWHDLEATRLAIDSLRSRDPDEDADIDWQKSTLHARAFLGNYFNLGTYASHVQGFLGIANTEVSDNSFLIKRRGFLPLIDRPQSLTKDQRQSRAKFLGRLDEYLRMIDRDALRAGSLEPDDFRQLILRRVRESADQYGVRLAFLLTPTPTPRQAVLTAIDNQGIGPLLDFCRPQTYPSLYSLDARFDWSHLNRTGAGRFSVKLAAAFAEVLDSDEPQAASDQDGRRPQRQATGLETPIP